MALKSVSGVTLYVYDVAASLKFYQSLGFLKRAEEAGYASVRLNWYWIDLFQAAEAAASAGGVVINIAVDDVDKQYAALVKQGMKPEAVENLANGNRQFELADPDGYRLGFFTKK